eukprot:13601089-Ditylum_brightwellii.AAC.1
MGISKSWDLVDYKMNMCYSTSKHENNKNHNCLMQCPCVCLMSTIHGKVSRTLTIVSCSGCSFTSLQGFWYNNYRINDDRHKRYKGRI